MRRARTVVCPTCGARWDAGRARFCGWCGRALRATELPVEAPDRPPRQWSRRIGWAGGVLAGVAALVAVALLADDLRLPRSRPDPAVELADGDDQVVPEGDPLSAEERAALLAPFDPNRLRCEPEGCEIWRRDLVDRQGFHTNVTALGDVVVVNVGNDIAAYDTATGEERWQQRWPATASARASANWTVIQPTDDGQLVVLARPDRGDLLALWGDGALAWHDDAGGHLHNLQVAGDALLTSGPGPAPPPQDGEEAIVPFGPLVVRDVATGTVRWQRDAATLMSASDRFVVAHEGGDAVVLDLATGAELSRRDLGPDPWLYPVGEVLIDYGAEDRQALLTPDLVPLPGLDGLAEVQPLAGDHDLVLALRHGEADGPTPDSITLVDGDGRVRWSADLDSPPGSAVLCCPQPLVDGEVLLLPAFDGGGEPVALRLSDGTRVEAPDSPIGDAVLPRVWWLTPQTALEHRDESVVVHHDGRLVEVSGQDSWPVNDEPPFVMTNGRSLLGVQPMPAD